MARGKTGFAVTDLGEGAKVLGKVRLKLVSRNRDGEVVIRRGRGEIEDATIP